MEIIPAYDRQEDFLALVREYTNSILQQGDEVRRCLSAQHLQEELDHIDKKYSLPEGRLYVALADGNAVGCVALCKISNKYCELKRLYVKPSYRGLHIGKVLAEYTIQSAKAIGYEYMRLDTFPFMARAIQVYQQLGFHFIEKYNDNPAENALFMELKL